MSRILLRSLILGACAVSVATLCLADQPVPAPQRAEGRKAPPATVTQPLPVATAPTAPGVAPKAGATHGIIFVGGKQAINAQPVIPSKAALNTQPIPPGVSSINSQPVPPGTSSINSQPVPPGRTLKPVGPGPGDPAVVKPTRSSLSH